MRGDIVTFPELHPEIIAVIESAFCGNVRKRQGGGPEQFLGFSLATEKEMILIVVKNCDKNAIMKAIMEKAGLESKAKSIVFSLPVTETAGMRLVEDE